MDGKIITGWSVVVCGTKENRKAGKIDRNFDDFAVNLNADEIPISWTEKGRRARRRTAGWNGGGKGVGRGGTGSGVLFSVDKFDDGIE